MFTIRSMWECKRQGAHCNHSAPRGVLVAIGEPVTTEGVELGGLRFVIASAAVDSYDLLWKWISL
jgi:hypothetical protein